MTEKTNNFEITSFTLHIIAMVCMLLDHAYQTLPFSNHFAWMTCLGRLAFPIFAFMIVEGFIYTKDVKKYLKRMFLFACISEIPFDFMTGEFYFHQNVLFGFVISLIALIAIDKVKKKENMHTALKAISILVITVAAVLSGFLTFVDYFGYGIAMVLAFYFFRGDKWYHKAMQIISMVIINVFVMGGISYVVNIFGYEVEILEQGLAVFAMIPILLYKGKQGLYNKKIKNLYYWFYPGHIAVLVLLVCAFPMYESIKFMISEFMAGQ